MKPIFLPIILFVFIVLFFFSPFIFQGRLSIPADTIVGLYHPFRDLYAKDYPNGIPFKNFLITDPVRQQYPWRDLVISEIKKLELPLWNPYSFSGTPLLANFQSSPFYPLNILFLLLPFSFAWSILIMLEVLLGGIFIYLYLNNLRLSRWASFLGSLTFGFCGFFVGWMEWGTILHVGLWLPLILLAIDKIFFYISKISNINPFDKLRVDAERSRSIKYQISNIDIKNKKFILWNFIFVFSLVSSFFAGHLQVFFYVFLFTFTYILVRWVQYGKTFKFLFAFFIFYILFFTLTAIQWIPTLQFILLSSRSVDQIAWTKEGWFIPWQHLIQFIAPDFFGNPSTLNYWGIWNYGEFVGYIGIAPLIMAVFALFFRRDKKTLFFGTAFFMSTIFAFPTIFANVPFTFHIPLVSSAQPTRLLFVIDICLAILAALGFDYFLRSKRKKEILYPLGFLAILFISLWGFAILGHRIGTNIPEKSLSVTKSNLRLPTAIFMVTCFLFLLLTKVSNKRFKLTLMLYCIIVAITVFDLLRFGLKFTPFTNKEYLFPQTKVLSFLQRNLSYYRFMTTDSRILPPNFSAVYRLQSIDGYDPLYPRRYAELIAASERSEPNVSPPFGFNRIITPHNYDSRIIDLLGVKYVLSLSDLKSKKLKKVFQEGQTRVYENKNAFPRTFFVESVEFAESKEEAIKIMFRKDFDSLKTAIVEGSLGALSNPPLMWEKGKAEVVAYSENRIIIKVENSGDGFMVLTDSFYPTWRARIDGTETKILRTDYNFRGIVIPKGKHTVEFYTQFF